MIVTPTKFRDVFVLRLQWRTDSRGAFARTFCRNELREIGFGQEIAQINQSRNNIAGTVRGLHYQVSPKAEKKLVRCIKGAVFDVIVDVRKGSPTFLQWFSLELTENNDKILYVPDGFAHGFQTLTDHAELMYLHSEFYSLKHERSLNVLDPTLKITWPSKITSISDKDRNCQFIDDKFTGVEL